MDFQPAEFRYFTECPALIDSELLAVEGIACHAYEIRENHDRFNSLFVTATDRVMIPSDGPLWRVSLPHIGAVHNAKLDDRYDTSLRFLLERYEVFEPIGAFIRDDIQVYLNSVSVCSVCRIPVNVKDNIEVRPANITAYMSAPEVFATRPQIIARCHDAPVISLRFAHADMYDAALVFAENEAMDLLAARDEPLRLKLAMIDKRTSTIYQAAEFIHDVLTVALEIQRCRGQIDDEYRPVIPVETTEIE